MISTTELTGVQLEQLDALLADTTPGGADFRPPVARDIAILRDLETAGLSRWTQDCGYEITAAGREVVQERAWDEADGEAFLREAPSDQLHEAIRKLTAVFNDLTDPVLRERALTDIEVCQDELDRRAETRTCWAPGDQEHDHEMCNDSVAERAESTGRHRAVPADNRPTETIARVELPTEPMPRTGLLDVPDQDSAERLLAAIKGSDTGEDVYDELAAETTGGWHALEADLGDNSDWWTRNRPVVLGVLVGLALIMAAVWLVIG